MPAHQAPNQAEYLRLARLYNLERYLFDEVSARFRRDGTLSADDFYAIIVWKSNRTKTKIQKGLEAAGLTASDLMDKVAKAGDDLARVKLLRTVKGIGLPIASAILTVGYPDRFTVLDYRAWESAQAEGLKGLPASEPATPRAYLKYRDACQAFAGQVGLSLRDLDRALWARSWEKDLQVLIAKKPAEEEKPTPAPEPRPKIKIHVAVYLASRMLASQTPTFTVKELINRVRDEFDDSRVGVDYYARSHCVANSSKGIATVYNYLWRIRDGVYRCYVPGQDQPHELRLNARTLPLSGDVPQKYRYLMPAHN